MSKKPLAYRGGEPYVFVSYAHADSELAYPLISGLQERGLRIWFDDGMDVGDLWDEVIPDHVEHCAAMLCLVSTRFTDSNNCLDEIHYAKEQKKELLILHLEDEDLPRSFRFRYGRFHALRLSGYSDRGTLLNKLASTQKLRCCLNQVQAVSQEQENDAEGIYQKGVALFASHSYEAAANLYRKAAALGHPGAMFDLGYCYANGHGVTQSRGEALEWYIKAAKKGNVMARRNLVVYYTNGLGVTKDPKRAEYWRNRANQIEYWKSSTQHAEYLKNSIGLTETDISR